jgi:multicomponent Na+:H+ antiporter subunit D
VTPHDWVPPAILLTSLVPGLVIFVLPEERHLVRTALNMAGAILKVVLVGFMVWGVFHGGTYEWSLALAPGLAVTLRADAMAAMFTSLSAVLWLVTTVYAIGYLEGSPNRSRFFGFFSFVVTSTMGVALAGNLFTFFVFYELLTASTYPLVVHRGTPKAIAGGRTYLAYAMTGGVVLMIGIVWLQALAGPIDFREGGTLGPLAATHGPELVAIFALLVAGLGVKAAIVPLHGWLPKAMVAPAPVSALLHAVAVVKAGAFGIVRVVYDVYGVQTAGRLGVMRVLLVVAAVTVVYGSVRAVFQDDLKKRLAFSTVSQVSYIVMGVAMAGPVSTIGGIVHLVHQGIMKITLFLCAGNMAETLHVHHVSELDGAGRLMPWTMGAFTVGALGMIGVPPAAGFVSKWYLGLGALESGDVWVVAVLAASSLLNGMYFLPILFRAWFREPAPSLVALRAGGTREAPWALLLPPLATAAMTLLAGLFAASDYSPLAWAALIAAREY